ncbi:uncharacterized protein TRAVEDRAFT_50071 [Trametes versicolor FP-101664 SS1]|uniref:uncharacterized protein n=1 Tax=Trametes versicolor (strain FP-101664) TaxID=717944 RepID=UPI0004621666|nr:uncharacterized protein TRAVEDRAFT_50071 [Trametes versicolor FP-101664 SS1]EIW55587.1 hypothetical protein TRAVEDRAFT_50071 [Trametes versicolor FP-101664 SS1]
MSRAAGPGSIAEELRARTAAPRVSVRRDLEVRDCPHAPLHDTSARQAPCRRPARPCCARAGKALEDSKLARMLVEPRCARPPAIEEPQACKS